MISNTHTHTQIINKSLFHCKILINKNMGFQDDWKLLFWVGSYNIILYI